MYDSFTMLHMYDVAHVDTYDGALVGVYDVARVDMCDVARVDMCDVARVDMCDVADERRSALPSRTLHRLNPKPIKTDHNPLLTQGAAPNTTHKHKSRPEKWLRRQGW